MDPEMKELYQVNGIGHILAISGLHLSFAGLGAYRLFRRLTGSYKAGGLAGGMLLFLYVSMIGMTVSVLRAWVMFLFRVGADVTGRKYDMPTALSVAAVIAVGSNPLYLYDGGFLLSFGAFTCDLHSDTIGEGRITAAGTGTYIGPGIAMNLCVVAVILYFFFEVPLYSVMLNLLVIPLMPVILSCGMAGSLVRMAGGTYGTWILMVCSRILKLYDGCCVLLLKFPVARWIAGRPENGGA